MHRIGAKAGLVPEVDFRRLCLGLLRNDRERIALPAFDGYRIALIGALQRLLRRQSQFSEQTADRGHAQADIEFPQNQLTYGLSRPQGNVKTVLQRVLAIHPAENL